MDRRHVDENKLETVLFELFHGIFVCPRKFPPNKTIAFKFKMLFLSIGHGDLFKHDQQD